MRSARHPTPSIQRLDPLGALDAWPVTIVVSVASVVLAAASTLLTASEVGRPAVAVLAVLSTAVGLAVLCWFARPSGAPLSAAAAAVSLLLLLAGGVLAFSAHPSGVDPRGSWAPYVIGLWFVAVASYRPAKEILLAGVVATLVVAYLGLQLSPQVDLEERLVLPIFAISPVLALSIGAASYAADYVRSVRRRQERAEEEARAFVAERRDEIALGVHENVVDLLNRELLPFFTTLLAKNAIDDGDSETARRISAAVRSIIVADVDENWLEALVRRELDEAGLPTADASGDSGTGVARASLFRVEDPDGVVDEIGPDGRAALGALVSLVIRWSGPRVDPRLRVRVRAEGTGRSVVLEFADSALARRDRAALRPYLSVLHSSFDGVRLRRRPGGVAIGFSYGQSTGR